MKFDPKKIIVILIFLISRCNIEAMDVPKKELTQLSPEELKDYKEKLYTQFCAAQAIKKKYLELLQKEQWKEKIRTCSDDELSTSESRCYNEYNEPSIKTGIFLSGYCKRLILPCGHWKFGGVIAYFGDINIEDVHQEIRQVINANFHKQIRVQRYPGKFAGYDLYKITKTLDGTPIPEVPDLNLSSEQAVALWQEMKGRYQKAERIP